jgi:hypothetical protein
MSATADVEGESLLPAGILQRQQEQGQGMALYALSLLLKVGLWQLPGSCKQHCLHA